MVDVLETLGGNAGLVWSQLKEQTPLTVKEISNRTKLSANDVYVAIGWLAREGKICIDDSTKSPRYGLTD
jgi:hypothetical protein